MDELLLVLNKYPNGTELVIEWLDKPKMNVIIDTIYETIDEEEREYYACAVKILSVEADDLRIYKVGNLLEISEQDPPIRIFDNNGNLVWNKV